MNIKMKSDDRIFHEICEQLEIRGELTNRENAFRIMANFLTSLYDSAKTLKKENLKLKHKLELYEKNATLLFQINQPTAKPYEYIVVIDNKNWVGSSTYENALKIAVNYKNSTIWSLEWDKYKGDWKLCNGEQFSDGKFLANTHYDYLHYGTLNSFLHNGNN